MKYVRTKDGIFESEEYWKRPPIEIMDIDEEIISQANTIEELCDEFVVYAPNEERITRYRSSEYFEKLKEIYKSIKEDKKEVYLFGAIWTDKGLIYVAKMNEKGELELL